MTQRRAQGPYIWVTTLAKLLTGESACEWAGWFKAHHEGWTKPPSDFDSTNWMLKHTALVNDERAAKERIGYTVYTENQNLFRLRGKTAIIAGRPDLIAENHHELEISDAKTGKPSPSHRAQVMIYQYAVPKALKQYQGKPVIGHVRYPNAHVMTPESAVDREFIQNLGALIRRLADEKPARRAPSAQECRFCDIGKEDCPVRVEVSYVPEGTTEDF